MMLNLLLVNLLQCPNTPFLVMVIHREHLRPHEKARSLLDHAAYFSLLCVVQTYQEVMEQELP